jgi:FKBP-type peptidyl-prolyl cis-trans isomerase SlyD
MQEINVIQFHYRLTDENGALLEDSNGNDPIAFLQGKGNIIPGLEKAIQDKSEGDSFTVTIAPEDGYGQRTNNELQRIPIKHILGDADKKLKKTLKPGMVVSVETDHGPRHVTIVKLGKFNADVDTNHPLAGKTLTFDVTIVSVRAATSDEISHGHAHGVGGHHH